MKRNLLLFVLLIAVSLRTAVNAQVPSEPYQWKNVQMRGGGFVDGVIYHPTEKNLLYCRTDMGGAYKWNEATKAWEPLLDWVSYNDRNLMGVEGIALDANDPNRVYMACGTYTTIRIPNAILRSDDRGKTFKRTDVPFRMGGNENGRGNGERMAVDPNNGNIIYMATRLDGLWKSEDAAVTWNRVNSFPEMNIPVADTIIIPKARYHPRPNGMIFVVFDPKSKADNKSATIYVGISQKEKENLFRSTDAGATWAAIPGEPIDLMPTHAILSADGTLYITYGTNPGPDVMTDGAVYKFNTSNGSWINITPIKPQPENQLGFGYAAVAVDPQHPQTIIVSTFHRYGKAGGDDIFRSLDAGSIWKPVFTGSGNGKFDYTDAPYVSHTPIHWLFDLEIDPFNSDHAIFTTGYGLHETFDLTDVDKGKPTTWGTKNKGIEETVALELLSPPKGVPLISAIGDYGGFVHNNLDEPAPEGNFINPHFANTDGVTCGAQNSNIVVRVGVGSTQVGGGNIGYSLDGGKTWQPTISTPQPGGKDGFISVSALGTTWIWTPQRSTPYVTTDKGTSWKQIAVLPNNTRVIADPLNDAKFYAMDLFNGKLYTSTDNGITFTGQDFHLPNGLPDRTSNRGDIRGGQDRLYAAPDKEGDLWIADFDGLYHAKKGSADFEKINGVTEIHGFGFGKAAPKSNYSALYLAGTINGVDGIFRSDDKGKNWVRINDDTHRWSLILQITGDPKKYGRVYVGTHGRGTFYGDISQSK
ncbi:hypothetical protein HDF18_07715 [Mucilaginibacter sp. X5P1]|uniref:hypothetical protein n=1 Tax=Mucilaginibacter sp. X5P1 TaxID=2723088 RepID=UPI0017FA675C|nr:hypothetical protein [Mucilaginibacter sp. X5P1]MBB6137534.1 photosystem II stability/assembly factor-like uncharacterized protein [Mucilaginibacter sp. X5P1]